MPKLPPRMGPKDPEYERQYQEAALQLDRKEAAEAAARAARAEAALKALEARATAAGRPQEAASATSAALTASAFSASSASSAAPAVSAVSEDFAQQDREANERFMQRIADAAQDERRAVAVAAAEARAEAKAKAEAEAKAEDAVRKDGEASARLMRRLDVATEAEREAPEAEARRLREDERVAQGLVAQVSKSLPASMLGTASRPLVANLIGGKGDKPMEKCDGCGRFALGMEAGEDGCRYCATCWRHFDTLVAPRLASGIDLAAGSLAGAAAPSASSGNKRGLSGLLCADCSRPVQPQFVRMATVDGTKYCEDCWLTWDDRCAVWITEQDPEQKGLQEPKPQR
mmetsp:Transcript_14942/g.41075  ORF Transcript_14942/g.41075 Transcript_14942/m.41075 type:complete len:345 (+) Transcript_14942:59-1093(+)